MKKISLLLMTAIMAVGLIACSNNDEPDNGGAQETTSGLYILNTGNMRSKIAPSITAYDFAIDTATPADQDAFYNANNFQLGEELQQAIVCNGKMYIAMYTSNMLWVVEPNTLKVITSIRFDGDAKSPRHLAEKDGKVYCSMYTGYVCEIDTKTDKISRTVKVGPNPEGMGIVGNTSTWHAPTA